MGARIALSPVARVEGKALNSAIRKGRLLGERKGKRKNVGRGREVTSGAAREKRRLKNVKAEPSKFSREQIIVSKD